MRSFHYVYSRVPLPGDIACSGSVTPTVLYRATVLMLLLKRMAQVRVFRFLSFMSCLVCTRNLFGCLHILHPGMGTRVAIPPLHFEFENLWRSLDQLPYSKYPGEVAGVMSRTLRTLCIPRQVTAGLRYRNVRTVNCLLPRILVLCPLPLRYELGQP